MGKSINAKRPSAPDARHARAAREGEDFPWLIVRGARHNNLRNIDVALPLGRFIGVTGVSGSGKSSLVNDILYQRLARDLNGASAATPGACDAIEGVERLDKIIAIDQTPIGRTPRSNPATYIKVFDEIRDLFTKLPDAKLRGYKPGRFSFNVSGRNGGGRCEACEGAGARRIEMDFLADVWAPCAVCEGRRFARETLQIEFKGHSIASVLEMDVAQTLELFENVPRVRAMLQTLHDVGLDYMKLGQPAPTLSGGEAQRIKLARELVKIPTGRTIYVLDEPTTGLHFEDVRKLLGVLHSFVEAGNTVVVIEHNLDVIKTADWIIDMGPEGGERGGLVVAEGAPEEVAANTASHTGAALRAVLGNGAGAGEKEISKSVVASAGLGTAALGPQGATPDVEWIRVVGARQHNLKDVTVAIPRERMTVCSGVSGSGKTSFAIDTVFTEGYRRYVESLSAYARQFLGQLQKPKVDHIEGLSPAICIEQKAASKSPRSTVGTITEIYDYLRVLWSRVGTPHCPRCDLPIGAQTVDEIVARIMGLEPGAPVIILAPVSLGDGENYATLFNRLKNSGFLRVRVDGEIQPTAHAITLDARRRRRVEVVIDRTIIRPERRSRIAESVEHALLLGGGAMTLFVESVERYAHASAALEAPAAGAAVDPEPAADSAGADSGAPLPVMGPAGATGAADLSPAREMLFSSKLACTRCGESYAELSPHHFSFNHQLGWCEICEGLGVQRGAPAETLISKPDLSILNGAIDGFAKVEARSPFGQMLNALCARLGAEPAAPLRNWTAAQRQALLFGTSGAALEASAFPGTRFHWRGLFPTIDLASRNSWLFRQRLSHHVTDIPCSACRGGRLRPEPAATRFAERTVVEICNLPLAEALRFFQELQLEPSQRRIAGDLLNEIRNRLQFLVDVGLDYLTLHRPAPTLSGGEAQRIRLASQIGSGLTGVLYVLDEPTIGLHPRDTKRLIQALQRLRDLGNTLLLVEHDREVIRGADQLLDFGPRAGAFGGEIVAQAAAASLRKPGSGAKRGAAAASFEEEPRSLTLAYLSGERAIPTPQNRRPVDSGSWPRERQKVVAPKRRAKGAPERAPIDASPDGPLRGWLVARGVTWHNLQGVDAPIPLGRLTCVTGVSGSGKSSLVNDVIWPALANRLNRASQAVGEHEAIEGIELLESVVNVDQSPIGLTPASNPATYTGVYDWIRELFARLPDSKARGYEAKRFSFNRPGGRCEACEGAGQKRVEMHFMPDVWIECEVCRGKRFAPETLEIRFKERTIADVLELRVSAALDLFANVPKIRRMLATLVDVGLGYLQLGQSAPTLSGGEAQRVKLAAELGKRSSGRTLYILDEPTTGLAFEDVRRLLGVLHRLVDLGNTVVVVEHNLDVIKSADWVIDLGPEAGAAGGHIVVMGTPEQVAATPESRTGVEMAPLLRSGPFETRARYDAIAHAAEELRAERERFGSVGKEARMPWQIDGRAWHLKQRENRDGKPTRWDSKALEFVEALVQEVPGFAPTDWSNRASVEITAPNASTWFLHALTGGEWLLELYFLGPAGAVDARELQRRLGLKTLDQRGDLPVYGDWQRVEVRPRRNGVEAIVIYPHEKSELDTPAFRKFVRDAASRYLKNMVPE